MRSGQSLLVFDLGGGSGALAEAICERVPVLRQVILVEQSAVLLAQAQLRASKHADRFLVQRGDLTSPDALVGLQETPDVVILSGVVAQQVLDRAQGLAVMQMCLRRLAPGGFVLVPSYSPALLTSEDYETMGFAVHNKTLQTIEERALKTHDFYILEKR
jgi:precorrin-6B methylase 2